jgi:hypothetical protein
VQIKQIEVVGAQPLQRALDGETQILALVSAAVDIEWIGSRATQGVLAGDDQRISFGADAFPDVDFAGSVIVVIGRVDEIAACGGEGIDRRPSRILRRRSSCPGTTQRRATRICLVIGNSYGKCFLADLQRRSATLRACEYFPPSTFYCFPSLLSGLIEWPADDIVKSSRCDELSGRQGVHPCIHLLQKISAFAAANSVCL